MKHCADIALKRVCADQPFIVYSQTTGLRAACSSLLEALRAWENEVNECAQWGHDSDALVFSWGGERWRMCGDIYEYELKHADPSRLRVSRPF